WRVGTKWGTAGRGILREAQLWVLESPRGLPHPYTMNVGLAQSGLNKRASYRSLRRLTFPHYVVHVLAESRTKLRRFWVLQFSEIFSEVDPGPVVDSKSANSCATL